MYSVVIPVLNETENLKVLLPKLLSENCEVLVCDNGSEDGSVEVARRLGTRVFPGTGTVTDAVLRGIESANYDKIVIMDADLSHPPEVVSVIVDKLDKYSLVVGSRYIRGGNSKDILWNRIVSRVYNFLTFGLAPRIKDRASGFWGVRKEYAGIPIRNTTKPMLEYLVRSGCNPVCEVPYTFSPRVKGKSKISRKPGVVLNELWGIFLLYVYKFRKPLKFCTVGTTGIGINLGLLWVFTEVGHIWYVLSALLSILIAAVWNYVLNNYWTFGHKRLL